VSTETTQEGRHLLARRHTKQQLHCLLSRRDWPSKLVTGITMDYISLPKIEVWVLGNEPRTPLAKLAELAHEQI
jgi:hypothetical protein